MAGQMIDYISEQPELRERFINYAFKKNPKISNFEEFESALFKAFDSENGQKASKWFNNDEVNELFNSDEMKEKIKDNVDNEEFKKLYKEENILVREIPKGQIIKPNQVSTYSVPKTIRIKRGDKIYYKGISKSWSKTEINFLKARRLKKLSVKQVLHEYTEHFKEKERTSDSIKSKYYSL